VSSRKERDRYIGRRRVPTPPRSRYAAVATTALIGAGVVAMATAAAMPDMKTDSASLNINNNFTANRQVAADKADRSNDRAVVAPDKSIPDVWLLPMMSYTVGTPFGERTGALQRGLELNAPQGTAFYAAHGGIVKLARWYGGYGYAVMIDAGNGVELVYGHASKIMVHEGQRVSSGDILALTGNTGYSFSPHVHFEIRVNGVAVDPTAYMLEHGVNIAHHTDSLTA
jgi:murein DD-endopeptidase MepM/ murein hydrolase activator NlpD